MGLDRGLLSHQIADNAGADLFRPSQHSDFAPDKTSYRRGDADRGPLSRPAAYNARADAYRTRPRPDFAPDKTLHRRGDADAGADLFRPSQHSYQAPLKHQAPL